MPAWHLGKCHAPYADGWNVVLEVEDDNSVDDVPNNPDDVLNKGKGFKRANAYFLGAEKINAINYTKAQVCVGYRATTDGCPRVKCYDLEDSWLGGVPANINAAGFAKPMSQAIACAAGGGYCGIFMMMNHGDWRLPIGHPGDPAPMDTYGDAKTGNLVWSCGGYYQWYGWEGNGWHFQSWGYTAKFGSSGQELLMYDNTCGNQARQPKAVANAAMDYMNLFQIRVWTPKGTFVFNIMSGSKFITVNLHSFSWIHSLVDAWPHWHLFGLTTAHMSICHKLGEYVAQSQPTSCLFVYLCA